MTEEYKKESFNCTCYAHDPYDQHERNKRYGLTFDSSVKKPITTEHSHPELCLFCKHEECNYTPPPGVDFICSKCVQLMLNADQDDLKKAHAKAHEFGYKDKVNAIESFLIPEDKSHEQRKPATKKHGRHINRKRTIRSVRNQKKRSGQVEAETTPAVL